jgi:hypothetical protein
VFSWEKISINLNLMQTPTVETTNFLPMTTLSYAYHKHCTTIKNNPFRTTNLMNKFHVSTLKKLFLHLFVY